QVTVKGVEPGNDTLTINGGAGNDTIDASKLHAGQVNLTLNGGDGNDTIIGSAGNDLVTGGRGNDVALLGAGDDAFVWNPGDGSDVVEGQAGTDTLEFNGANIEIGRASCREGARAWVFGGVGEVTEGRNGGERLSREDVGGGGRR